MEDLCFNLSESFLTSLTQTSGWELTNSGQKRQYRLEILSDSPKKEYNEAFEKQKL